MKAAHLMRGDLAEDAAARLLENAGYRILQRNVRYACGEIDLIAGQGSEAIFVEVRYRRNARFGGPLESIDQRKCRRLIAAADLWLQQHDPGGQLNCRFDIIAYCGSLSPVDARWIEDAFGRN